MPRRVLPENQALSTIGQPSLTPNAYLRKMARPLRAVRTFRSDVGAPITRHGESGIWHLSHLRQEWKALIRARSTRSGL